MFEQLQEAVQDGPKPQEVKVVNVQKAENQSKKNRRKITQEGILEEHYKALIAKQDCRLLTVDFLTKYCISIPLLIANCKQANQSAIQTNLTGYQG